MGTLGHFQVKSRPISMVQTFFAILNTLTRSVNMKLRNLVLPVFLAFAVVGLTSCGSNKTGCPVNENAHVKTNSKGELPTKRGKSNLFPKNMRKR
jgi:hypothetical protein